jgi:hypothetical protein
MPYGGWLRGLGALVVGVLVLAPTTVHAERIVYINLDQTVLTNANGQDPTTNSFSSTGFTPGTIDGWDLSPEDHAELLYWFKEATIPFDIVFVDERPAVGSYDMLVFGTEANNTALFDLGCSASIGLADCTDTNAQNISFMFYGCISAAQQADMKRVAFYGLTGLGFGWGLENLVGTGQIMASYSLSGLEFGDECTAISGASQCTHVGCAASTQNSTSDLDAIIGPRVDDGPPVVTITGPANLSVVEPDVTIEARVEDAFGGLVVSLEIVETGDTLDDAMPPYAWDLVGVPDGMWTIRVSATDADMNSVAEDVVICVGVDDCGEPMGEESSSTAAADESSSGMPSDDGESSGGAETSTGAAEGTTSDVGSDDGAIDPTMTPLTSGGLNGGDAVTGCGCRSDRASPAGALAWAASLLAWRRRRRS